MRFKRHLRRSEPYIFAALLLLCLAVELRSGQFFTGNNIVDLARSLTVPAIFCIGEMLVLISGGVDVSFPAIASLSMYVVSRYLDDYQGTVALNLFVGAVLGLVMGGLNGFLVARFRFPAMLVTLGTTSVFSGILFGALGAREYPVPPPMYDLGKAKLFSAHNPVSGLSSDMPVSILLLALLLAATWFLLNRTLTGRGIYAIGGDPVAAERAGFNLFRIQMFIYCFSGALAGLTGVIRGSMMLNCHPTNLNGMEMTCIAACVLGGASITGGKGTLFGVMLGITLMTVMANSLILIGVPTYWQRVFTGAIILVGTGVSAYQALRGRRKPGAVARRAGHA
ncbi:MAG: ABC transporter permease [Planctomycetota bacterium]|jgi:simple sugar transport system permease protein|nr:ABC transporter permease [Planctomycetota bacterium]